MFENIICNIYRNYNLKLMLKIKFNPCYNNCYNYSLHSLYLFFDSYHDIIRQRVKYNNVMHILSSYLSIIRQI